MDENLKKAKEALAKKDDKIAELKGEKVAPVLDYVKENDDPERNKEVVKNLLEYGAEINSKDTEGVTELMQKARVARARDNR